MQCSFQIKRCNKIRIKASKQYIPKIKIKNEKGNGLTQPWLNSTRVCIYQHEWLHVVNPTPINTNQQSRLIFGNKSDGWRQLAENKGQSYFSGTESPWISGYDQFQSGNQILGLGFVHEMEMDYLTEFPLAHMDRRPRKKPRFAWDAPQSNLKVIFLFFSTLQIFFSNFSEIDRQIRLFIMLHLFIIIKTFPIWFHFFFFF